jgi:hypothetical protein
MSALTKITTRAKQIRRSKKSMTWKAAIKQASREYNGGKKLRGIDTAMGRTRAARRKKRRRVGSVAKGPRPLKYARTIAMISGVKKRRAAKRGKSKPVSTRFKNDVKKKLSKALLDYDLAKTVKATKEAQKRKIKFRKMLRAL